MLVSVAGMGYHSPSMPDNPPLTDDQVYELLHAALLSFSHRTVETATGEAVLRQAIEQIEALQQAMVAVMEEDVTGKRE